MTNLKDKTALVFDSGLFTFIAERLARDFGRVYYYSPWKTAFSKSSALAIGSGIDGVERLKDFWPVIDKVDLFVFPDIGQGDLQTYLRSVGKRVFGCGLSDSLETDRWSFRKTQQSVGMKIPKTTKVVGVDDLRSYLEENKDCYVKINFYRGDLETFHHIDYNLSEPFLTDLEYRLGAMKNDVEFVVEQPIKSDAEVGYDGWCVDGKFPSVGMFGYEVKDKSYVGKIVKYQDMPDVLKKTNEQISSELKRLGMRGFYSSEVRIVGEGGVLLDPCMRSGSPPGEVVTEAYKNYSEIIWEAADGKTVEPIPNGEYTALALIHSKYSDAHWMSISYPDKYKDNVKLKNKNVNEDGDIFSVPTNNELYAIGAVVAVEKTLDSAIAKIKKVAEEIKGYDIEVKLNALDDAEDVIKAGEKHGIQF